MKKKEPTNRVAVITSMANDLSTISWLTFGNGDIRTYERGNIDPRLGQLPIAETIEDIGKMHRDRIYPFLVPVEVGKLLCDGMKFSAD